MSTQPDTVAGRPDLESKAFKHLWTHSNEFEWDELVDRGLRVFVSGDMSTITDVQGRTYLDGLAGLFLVVPCFRTVGVLTLGARYCARSFARNTIATTSHAVL